MSNGENRFRITFNGIVGFMMMVAFFVLLFFIARGVFQLLAWLSPILIIGALLINYRTVTGYLRFIWDLLNRRPLAGVLAVVLSVIGFPILSGVLFGKSLLDRKVRKLIEEREPREEFIDYEDVTEEEPLDLPRIEKEKQQPSNPYSDYLDED